MKNLIRFTSLCGAVVLFPVGNTIAQTSGQCAIAPTCAELGYEQKAADCNGQYMLKCPFDQTKVFCGGTACSEDFKLSACDSSLGTCSECGGKYKYTACQEGWTLTGGKCVENTCSQYPFSSAPDSSIGKVVSCKPGASALKYGYSSCEYGWDLSGGRCTMHYCGSSYDLRSCPSNANCYSCQSGKTTYYEFRSCFTGYEWTGYSCSSDGNCPTRNKSLSGYQTSYTTCIGNNTGTTYYNETACIKTKCDYCGNGSKDDSYVAFGGRCQCYRSVSCGGLE